MRINLIQEMNMNKHALIISAIGFLLFFTGLVSAFLGPVEVYCYYMFSEGGRFHYDGFGMGSLMFGNITMQIWGYYLIAFIFIPLGIGHLKKQAWIQKISLTLLYVWLIVGLPILPIILMIIIVNKEPSLTAIISYMTFALAAYTILTPLLIKFYKSNKVKATLNIQNQKYLHLMNYPLQLMIINLLCIFYIFTFHGLLLFRGIFPFFGHWLIGLKGIMIVSSSILVFMITIIGTISRKMWSWWTALIYFSFLMLSSIITFMISNFSTVVELLQLPKLETQALSNIPLSGFHLSCILGIPMIISLIVIISSKKFYFT